VLAHALRWPSEEITQMPDELAALVGRHTMLSREQTPFETPIPGVTLVRASAGRHPRHVLHQPALCLVVQGAKRTVFGETPFDYSAGQGLIVSTTIPGVSRIRQATAVAPYLGVIIEFDAAILRDVYLDMVSPPAPSTASVHAAFTVELDERLRDCVLRGLRLLEMPKAIPVLYPAFMRELCFWLLAGPHGANVARVATGDVRSARMLKSIQRLRDRFAEPLKIGELASTAHLSRSAYHRQFKALTGMTPLDYQKQLRLLEARHLLSSGEHKAEAVAQRVGYQSASHFSREYARNFGLPPKRDIAALARQGLTASADGLRPS
jgi:AraC-like DNA-binding protein